MIILHVHLSKKEVPDLEMELKRKGVLCGLAVIILLTTEETRNYIKKTSDFELGYRL